MSCPIKVQRKFIRLVQQNDTIHLLFLYLKIDKSCRFTFSSLINIIRSDNFNKFDIFYPQFSYETVIIY